MDILFLSSDLDSPRARVQPADGRRGLRDLIASFGQNIVTVPSETTHVWVKFDRDHACRDPVDTCLSCCGLLFAAEQRHTCDLAVDLDEISGLVHAGTADGQIMQNRQQGADNETA